MRNKKYYFKGISRIVPKNKTTKTIKLFQRIIDNFNAQNIQLYQLSYNNGEINMFVI